MTSGVDIQVEGGTNAGLVPIGLDDRHEQRQSLQRRQLFFVDENIRVFEFGDHLLGIGDEIRGEYLQVGVCSAESVYALEVSFHPPDPSQVFPVLRRTQLAVVGDPCAVKAPIYRV
jgi:hypothetical protein